MNGNVSRRGWMNPAVLLFNNHPAGKAGYFTGTYSSIEPRWRRCDYRMTKETFHLNRLLPRQKGSPMKSEQTPEIFRIAAKREFEKLKHVVTQNPTLLQERNDHQWTLLHIAASVNHCEMAKWLIEKGVPLDAAGNARELAIHIADSVEMAAILIEHGSPVNPADRNGMTPLDFAMAEGNTELVTFLVSRINPDVKVMVLPDAPDGSKWN